MRANVQKRLINGSAGSSHVVTSHKPNKKDLEKYIQLVNQIAAADELNMLASCEEAMARWDLTGTLLASKLSLQTVLLERGVMICLVRATVHVLSLAVRVLAATVVDSSSSVVLLFSHLSRDVMLMARSINASMAARDVLQEQFQRLNASDLLPALACYSQAIVQALKLLAAAAAAEQVSQLQQQCSDSQLQLDQEQQAKQQQQHPHHCIAELIEQHKAAAKHAKEVLQLWCVLLDAVYISSQPVAELASSLSAAIHLAAVAVLLLSKGLVLAECCSAGTTGSNSSTVPATVPQPVALQTMATQQHVQSALSTCLQQLLVWVWDASKVIPLVIAKELKDVHPDLLQGSQLMQPRRKQQQQILLSDKLPELLMLSLAHQAVGQSMLIVQSSAPLRHQQQRIQQQRKLWNSSRALLRTLGLPHELATTGLALKAAKYDEAACHRGMGVLNRVMGLYDKLATARNHDSSHQQQDSTGSGREPWLPEQLVLPAVNVMINKLLLAPAEETNVYGFYLQHALNLLKMPPKPRPKPPENADVRFLLEWIKSDHRVAEPWPESLSASVAAALLHPVVGLLSRAVLRSLKATSPQRQQGDSSTGDISEADDVTEAGREMLLLYAELLMSVCLSVEPKHIAAVLRSDPVTPLIAAEAAIRAWACEIAPGSCQSKSQLQEQPHAPSDAYPGQLATHLLPFAARMVSAIHIMIQDQQFQSHLRVRSDSATQSNPDSRMPSRHLLERLVVRVSSLLITACKVGRMAAMQWQQQKQQAARRQSLFPRAGTHGAVPASDIRIVEKQVEGSIDSWYTTGGLTIAATANTMSKLLCKWHSRSDCHEHTQPCSPDSGICTHTSAQSTGLPGRHSCVPTGGPEEGSCTQPSSDTCTPSGSFDSPDSGEQLRTGSASASTASPASQKSSPGGSCSGTGRLHSFLLVLLLRAADACVLQLRAEYPSSATNTCSAEATEVEASCSAVSGSQATTASSTGLFAGYGLVASSSIAALQTIAHLLLSSVDVLQCMIHSGPALGTDATTRSAYAAVRDGCKPQQKLLRYHQLEPLEQLWDLVGMGSMVVYCLPCGESGKYCLACSSAAAPYPGSPHQHDAAVTVSPPHISSSSSPADSCSGASSYAATSQAADLIVGQGPVLDVQWRPQPWDFV